MASDDPLRWIRRGVSAALVVIGWGFITWQHKFHATAPVVIVCLGYLAVVLMIVNLWRTGAAAMSPEHEGEQAWSRPIGARGELEKEKKTLLKAIKEAEFDHEMGKLSKADADEMIHTYRARAIEVIKELERYGADGLKMGNVDPAGRPLANDTVRDQIAREVKARLEIEGAAKTKKKKARAEKAATGGKPLPSPDLPGGTVSVRVVAGSPSSPVEGTDVTLIVNGTPRVARTDSAGRAIFKDLPTGATVQAKVVDADKKETQSEAFPLPSDSGVRLMLTTKPWNPGAGAGMGGADGGAMPDPINMSGQARIEQNDAAGTFTVRLTYDDFKDPPPAGTPVALVGYTADDQVLVQWAASDKDGHATFKNLDRSGATAYFALTQLPRNNAIDRLESIPTILDNRSGMRLILSCAKRAATDPPIDEFARLDKQDPPPAEGKVRVSLEGLPSEAEIRLFQIDAQGKKTEVGHLKPTVGAPDPTDLVASANPTPKADLPPGNVDVIVHGGVSQDDQHLGGETDKIVKDSAKNKHDQ